MQRETMKCNKTGKMQLLMGQLTGIYRGCPIQRQGTLTEHREGLGIMGDDLIQWDTETHGNHLIQQDMETHRNHGRYFNSTGSGNSWEPQKII